MAYFLQQNESVADGIRRIAREELDAANRELDQTGPGHDERVHSVRKRIKKLRALLRSIRRSLGGDGFRLDNARCRDAAHGLEAARRAAAMLGAFDALVARYADQISPRAFDALRRSLSEQKRATVTADAAESEHLRARALLDEVLAGIDDWPLQAEDFSLIAPNLRDVYRQARRAFVRAYVRDDSDAFHEWRKRTKDYWYHLRLLEPSFEGPLGAMQEELHRLSELLGDDHDLADLHETLIGDPAAIDGENAGALLALLERRQSELRREARTLGERVFAERPNALVRRLRIYFEVWQSETSHDAASSSDGAVDETHDLPDDPGVAQDADVAQASRLDQASARPRARQ